MKKLSIILFALAIAGPISAQETSLVAEADSVNTRQLDELVVEGRTQRVVKFGVEYTPDKKLKKQAIDATHLLSLMQIPQLNVSPGSTSVTNLVGSSYSLFIDYIPASSADVSALRPQDVLRVEVLQYPQDPRFNSAQYVVNFIMVRYEWGGYTKLKADSAPLDNPSVGGSVYSKFVKDKWIFDANGGASGNWGTRVGSRSEETYRDIWYNGRRYNEIERLSEIGDDFKTKSNSEWASIRAAYTTNSTYISHTLSFSRNAEPYSNYNSNLQFTPQIINSSSSHNESNSQSLSPGMNAYYQFILPKGNSIVASWSFAYGHTRSHNLYQLLSYNPILKDNREDVYVPNVNVSYSKSLGHNNTFRTSLMTYNSIYDTRYDGSYVDRQKMLSSENMLFLEYMQNWGFGLTLYSRVGASYVVGRLNNRTTLSQWNPRLGFSLEYQINDRHSASLQGWWGNSHPSPSTTNDALIQNNELSWSMGNPDVRNTIFQTLIASYNFIPNNIFALSANLQYEGEPDRQATEYFILPDHDGLVHRTINSGRANLLVAIVSASARLLKNSLNIKVTGWAERNELTGLYGRAINEIRGSVTVQYIRNHWSLLVYYNPPSKDMGAWSYGVRSYTPQSYGLRATCSFGDFNAQLSFSNWFRRDGYLTNVFDSPLYSAKNINRSSNVSRGLSLTLTYTFPYGKKVNRSNELKEASGVGSAILQ